MAASVQVPGPVLIKIDAGAGLESLGYSVNGIEIEEHPFYGDVPGDQNGGDEGPPIDIQYFGEIHRLHIELSNWDAAVAAKLIAKINTGTAGVAGTPGVLMLAGGWYYRLLLVATNTSNNTRNYLRALVRDRTAFNLGTKFKKLSIDFECHANAAGGAGVIWNTTVV